MPGDDPDRVSTVGALAADAIRSRIALTRACGELADLADENRRLFALLREERGVAEVRLRALRRQAAELFAANGRVEELEAR